MYAAKVIATCFVKRELRFKSSLVGDPVGYFNHSQVLKSPEEVVDLIKYNISLEKKVNPGILKRDLIIVNNDVGYKNGNNFLRKISGSKIPFGKIITCNRKNIGMSFGAYDYAFKKFKDKYDYFLFTEDDTIIAKKNYFKIGINLLNMNNKGGFLAYIHSTKVDSTYYKPLSLNKNNAITAHGATGLSSTKILKKILKKYKKLPHYNGNNYKKCIIYGEVGFPNSFIKIGYKIIDLPKDLVLTIPANDLINKRQYKKWPNKIEILYHYFKHYVYKVFAINSFSDLTKQKHELNETISLRFFLKILSSVKNILNLSK
jgi:hypothetical protein